ncbi:4-hydroxy-tetrahydrodipicolinate reductase (HTPA reductase), partial [Durusdinium trenchii]
PTSETTLVYLLKHKSRDAARASWDAFRNDPEWKDVAAASRKAHGKILAKAPEATYLELTDYSPAVGAPDAEKVFELRTYTSPEGKLSELHDRFRKYTDDLFQKHGMTSYGYWAPTDPPASGNVMIYLLEHSSRDAARDSWKAFLSDPEWKEVARKTQENGPLLSKRPDAVFLKLTDYSPRESHMAEVIKLAVNGAAGRMGQRIVALAHGDTDIEVVAALESASHPAIGKDAGVVAGLEPIGVAIGSEVPVGVDVVIDFSMPEAAVKIAELCGQRKIPLVEATTGMSAEQLTATLMLGANTIGVCWADARTAVNVAMKIVRDAARALKGMPEGVDVEIIERHHRYKEDAPSGTALRFGDI